MTNWIISMDLEAARYCFSDLVIELRPQLNTLILETPDHSTVILSINEWPALRDFIDRALTLQAAPQPQPQPQPEPQPQPQPEPQPQPQPELKPFNREAALAGAPVRTRDGRRVIAVTQDPDATESYPLLAWIERDECLYTFTNKGEFRSTGEETQNDLFME